MATRKRKTNRKKRQTKRYIGGAQKLCEVCCPDPTKPNPKIICYYHTYKSEGAPPGTLTNGPNYNTNAFYEDHIRTHPICKYCLAQDPLAKETLAQDPLAYRHYDTKALAEHIQNIHPEKYATAQKIKTDLINNKINLITDLIDNNTRIIGIPPELLEFYNQIEEKETKMAEEVIKKQRQLNAVKPKAKPDSAAKAKAKADAELKAIEAEAEAKARVAEENRLKREEADKRKAEKLAMEAAKAKEQEAKAEEEEAIRKAARDEAYRAKKADKKAAKAEARELEQMGQEEELSKQLRAAQTVDKVINIINNSLPQPPLPPAQPPLPPVEPPLPPVEPPLPPAQPSNNINIKTIFEKRILNDNKDFYYKLKYNKFQREIHEYIHSIFPLLSCNTGTIHNASYYKTVSLIIFIVGILNMLFKLNKVNIKLVIKGGKAAQMMLSTYGYPTCDINSDDIDILLIQENGHDREYLMDIARQIAYLIQDRFIVNNNESISILNPTQVNPNIYKISLFTSNGYKPISDIDFKYDNSGFFTNDKIMELPLNANYNGNEFGLLYYFQNPNVFLEEKKHYLAIYENIVQKTHDGSISCDCNVKNTDHACKAVCNYRLLMVEKFKKYIAPFEQLLRPKTPSARHDV